MVTTKVENCLAYDGKGNCMRCEKFFYISSLKCVKVNPLCSGYNEFTGGCRACYADVQSVMPAILFKMEGVLTMPVYLVPILVANCI